MLKPGGLAVAVAFWVVMALICGRAWRRLVAHTVALLIGLAVPATVVLVYISGARILTDMPALYRQIAQYAAQTPWETYHLTRPATVAAFLAFPLFVRGWIFRRRRIPAPVSPALIWFAILWLAIESAGVVLQWRMYTYHFLVLVPPAALLFGMLRRSDESWPLAAALLPAAAMSVYLAAPLLPHVHLRNERLPASDYLAARTGPGDAIWQDSMPRLLLETNLKPGARYPLTFLFVNYDTAPLEYSTEILADFNERRPTYILLDTDLEKRLARDLGGIPQLVRSRARAENYLTAWRRIEAYVKERYTPETAIDGETVYRRR